MASLKYSDLLDIMDQRAMRLGLIDGDSKKPDTAELELYIFQALLYLTDICDLTAYTIQNTNIVATQAGVAQYPLPDDFGRLITPRVQNKRGIYLFDTVDNTDLTYIDANSFARLVSKVNGKPQQFTITQRKLWLFPTPDVATYTVRGLYMQKVDRPDLDDDVLVQYPTALIDEALFRLASDMGRVSQTLTTTRTESLTRLVAGSK